VTQALQSPTANLDAERSVLGALLVGAPLPDLSPEDFFKPSDSQNSAHGHIFAAMQYLKSQGRPIDLVLLTEELKRRGQLEECGGAAYVASLPDGMPKISNVEHYARIVTEKAILRRVAAKAELAREMALSSNGNAAEMLGEIAALCAVPSGQKIAVLGSCSTAELFAAQEKNIEWLCWPFAAVGLASILDALPKLGKTVLLLRGIHASREHRPFLNFATKPMRVCYVSEQSKPSLAMQAREIGFTGGEPIEELRWITREDWSRHIYTDFLVKLEREILEPGNYNCLIVDTLHTVSRMEDERDASEVNRLGNLTIDVATRNKLALALGRHDRKSGGDIGVSGRSSIQLSGLVDVILHLVRVPNESTQRKLELLGRVPGLPNEQLIDLVNGVYLNWGAPETVTDKTAQVGEWLEEDPNLTGEQIVARFANQIPPVVISLSSANRYKVDAKQSRKRKRKP
jgi:hypothetical protein